MEFVISLETSVIMSDALFLATYRPLPRGTPPSFYYASLIFLMFPVAIILYWKINQINKLINKCASESKQNMQSNSVVEGQF